MSSVNAATLASLKDAQATLLAIHGACNRLARAFVDIEAASASMLEAVAAAGDLLPPVVVEAARTMHSQAAAAGAVLPAETTFLARYVELIWKADGKGDAQAGSTVFRANDTAPGSATVAAYLEHVTLGALRMIDQDGQHDRWITFGPRTAICPLEPLRYQGQAIGIGAIVAGGAVYQMVGTLILDLDFPGARFEGTLALSGTDRRTSAIRDFGTLSIVQGTISEELDLDASIQTSGGTWLGFLEGALHGPRSEEFGATFGLLSGSYPAWDAKFITTANLAGAAIGRRSS